MPYGIGIDIGSTCAKTIVMDENGGILRRMLQPTGWSSVDTAEGIRESRRATDVSPSPTLTSVSRRSPATAGAPATSSAPRIS